MSYVSMCLTMFMPVYLVSKVIFFLSFLCIYNNHVFVFYYCACVCVGACRAVYADLFRGDDLATAFSAQTLLTGLSGGICFFIFGSLSRTMISVITIVNGVVALVAYGVLMRRGERMGDPVSWSELCGCSTTTTATATTTHYNGHTHTHPDIQHYQAIND